MSDTISRQAAIDAVMRNACNTQRIYEAIKGLPSEQPETHDKRTESHACDLISRQAVIDALRTHERKPSKKWLDNQLDIEWNNAIDICCYDIEDLPSAQPEQQWIPCSERLPDRFGKMLVTFIPGTLWTYVIIANYSDLMGIAKPCFWIGNVGKNDFANITSQVVAWMPLPEPYREEEQDG